MPIRVTWHTDVPYTQRHFISLFKQFCAAWSLVPHSLAHVVNERRLYLWLQVDVGQWHLGHLVEADGQRDGAEYEQAVVNGHPHQNDGLHVGSSHLDHQGADQINHQKNETDAKEDQVQRKSGRGETALWILEKLGKYQLHFLLWQPSRFHKLVKLPVLQ